MFCSCRLLYETRTDRILQDISRKYSDVIIWSEDAIVVSLLPKPAANLPRVPIARSLFGEPHEAPKIRPIGETFDQ